MPLFATSLAKEIQVAVPMYIFIPSEDFSAIRAQNISFHVAKIYYSIE